MPIIRRAGIEDSDQVVGLRMAFLREMQPDAVESELQAYVLNIYTLPEWRGRGIATMLLQHIIEYVKTTPASRISLNASEMGRPVYECLGFKASDGAMILKL